MDTGSDLCVFPRSAVSTPCTITRFDLGAANNTVIHTYGPTQLNLEEFSNVSKPILGVDFLSYYNLFVDCRNQRLIDNATNFKY